MSNQDFGASHMLHVLFFVENTEHTISCLMLALLFAILLSDYLFRLFN